MTTRFSSLIDDIEACFDSLSLTTSGPDELRQKLAALRKAVALPADTAVVGEEAGVTRWSMEKLTGSVTLTPCVRDDGEWVKFADVVDICAANQKLRREARSPTGGREAGMEAGVTMQAVVRVDEFNGQTLWECTERDGRGEVSTHETVELAASTFPIGTKLLISEPTP